MHRGYAWVLFSTFLVLVLCSSVRADWEEFTKPLYLDVSGENYKGTDLLEVENYFIKLNSLNYDTKVAGITVSDRNGVTYYNGLISPYQDYRANGKTWVVWDSLKISDGHPQVRFKIFLWQQLSIFDFNTPPLMNWEDEYNVYMDWKNVGDTPIDAFFKLVAQDGFVSALKLDQNIHFDPGEEKRVYFKLRPEKYVTTGPLTATRQNLEDLSMQLLVYSAQSGNLLRRVDLGKYSLTSGPSAFIEEIVTPLTQFVGKEYQVKIRMRNSGYPQKNTGNLVQDSFVISLEAPGFTIRDSDKQYIRMDPLTTKELTFVVTPHSGGVRNMAAFFMVDRKVAATLVEKIAVKGTKTLLLGDLSNVPAEFSLGGGYKIPVKVLNKGDFTEEVVVRVSSENFKFKNPENVIKLPPNSNQEVVFDAIAEKVGDAGILFEVIATSQNLKVTQYFKSSGIAADEKTLRVAIVGSQSAESQEVSEEPVSKPKPTVTEPTSVEERTEEPAPTIIAESKPKPVLPEGSASSESTDVKQPSFSLINAVLLIVGIVVVLILIALIVKMATKKGSHKRKKKRSEGDFELD